MGTGGRHVRFSVTSGGTRSRAVGFGIAPGNASLGKDEIRHDLAARLEANEWQGSVEPRLVVRSLHAVEENEECSGGRSSCDCRKDDAEWWTSGPGHAYEGGRGHTPCRTAELPNCELQSDHRNEGALGLLGDLMTTGRVGLLVVCAPTTRGAPRSLSTRPRRRPASRARPWARLPAHCATAGPPHVGPPARRPTPRSRRCRGPGGALRAACLHSTPHRRQRHMRSWSRSGPGFLHLGSGDRPRWSSRALSSSMSIGCAPI